MGCHHVRILFYVLTTVDICIVTFYVITTVDICIITFFGDLKTTEKNNKLIKYVLVLI